MINKVNNKFKTELSFSIKGQWTKITWPFEIPHQFPIVICFSLLLLTWNYTKMNFRSPHRGAIMLQFEEKKKIYLSNRLPSGLIIWWTLLTTKTFFCCRVKFPVDTTLKSKPFASVNSWLFPRQLYLSSLSISTSIFYLIF